jgi:hypothetical protein
MEIRPERLPPLADGDVRIRATVSAISRGTEALISAGRVPVTEYRRMRAPFMGGEFPFPVKYGYAMVGEVEAGPANLIGQTVFTLHPHQTLFDLPADSVLPVPGGVPAQRAALAANMETALNASWDAAPCPAGRVAVVGAGVIGALTGFVCARGEGADVTLSDIDPAREALAKALGLKFATPAEAPRDCDVVFHTSASAEGLSTAIDIAGDEASIIEMSWYGSGTIPVPLGGAFHSRRLKIVASQVGQVAPSRRATVSHRQRLEQALGLLADPCLDALLAPPLAFRDLPALLPNIFKPQSGVLCQLVTY